MCRWLSWPRDQNPHAQAAGALLTSAGAAVALLAWQVYTYRITRVQTSVGLDGKKVDWSRGTVAGSL
jgi:hypothetical protein